MGELADRVAALSPEKLALLEQRLAAREGGGGEPELAPRRRSGDSFPLSFAQERLWFLDRFHPGSPLYNLAVRYPLFGPLDDAAVAWSLNEIVRRHEALRTTFVARDGRPVQVVAPALDLEVPVADLRGFPPAERGRRAAELAGEHGQQSFALDRGPLLAATLIHLTDESHLLLLTMHHIVSDGWSMGILSFELGTLLQAHGRGGQPALPRLPLQYVDFALWQREWLQGEVLEAQLGYWRRQLQGLPPQLDLPADRPRPPVQTFRGATRWFGLAPALAQGLRALSQRQGTTLFMTLLAGFDALLHRYTGRRRVVVGTLSANRNRAEIEGLIGFFVNTLVLATPAAGELPFEVLLGRVREVTLDAFAHQDLPFEKLVEELQPERSLGHHPLFQVMFVLQNSPTGAPVEARPDTAAAAPAWTAPAGSFETPGFAKFDLSLYLWEAAGGLAGAAEYSTDLFDRTTIRRLVGHFERLLEAVVAEPRRRLSDLALQSPAQVHQIAAEWSPAAAPLQGRCAHDLAQERADLTPEAIALSFEDERLSYRRLDRLAHRLAHRLRALGVGPEGRVGLALERCPAMVVGVLGTLKAGGAYVPLDPAHPPERLSFMLADSAAAVLVAGEPLGSGPRGQLPAALHLDAGGDGGDGASASATARPASGATLENAAYLIFTSGSTGSPKAVVVSHRALANLLGWMRRRPGLGAGEALAAVTTLSFDIASAEVLLPLVAGGRIELLGRRTAVDGERLAAALAALRPSLMQATPATWKLLLQRGWPGQEGLRVVSGGEAMPRWLADALAARCAEVWNLYGPSETTIWSTGERVAPGAGAVSIGRPIDRTRALVCDRHGRTLPLGVPGELLLGGGGLARGYAGRPGRTAASFVPAPAGVEPGGRLYRSGDLARWLAEGRLEFLGRIDHQLKVRGFRVEPGEVEAALSRSAGVEAAVVTAREDASGSQQLVAYVVARGDRRPTAAELRGGLAAALPEPMIPAAFVFLDALPLTASGKVDRRALPAPGRDRPEAGAAFVPPGNAVEAAVAGIWAEVLGVERVGIDDNFFELGGHSLLASQVLARTLQAFAVDLPLPRLFQAPTVRGLAAALAEQRDEGRGGLPGGRIVRVARRDGEELLAGIDGLSEPEVDALLRELLAREEREASAAGAPRAPAGEAGSIRRLERGEPPEPLLEQLGELASAELDQLSDDEVDALLRELAPDQELAR